MKAVTKNLKVLSFSLLFAYGLSSPAPARADDRERRFITVTAASFGATQLVLHYYVVKDMKLIQNEKLKALKLPNGEAAQVKDLTNKFEVIRGVGRGNLAVMMIPIGIIIYEAVDANPNINLQTITDAIQKGGTQALPISSDSEEKGAPGAHPFVGRVPVFVSDVPTSSQAK